ncbi:MAG: CDP-glycerol glycerophosphotransferase family protein [Lachnospiraceae bacterium]|nr:CDP-glycerol glycerophosphotransferase family protein [Lachnospiraceae bacterium]
MSELSVPVTIDLMEYENGNWRLDGSVDPGIRLSGLIMKLNGKKLFFREVPRYAQITCENQIWKNRKAFALELSSKQLQKRNVIKFAVLDDQGNEKKLPVAAVNYQARVHSGLKYSYWCFDKYLVTLQKENTVKTGENAKKGREAELLADALVIRRTGRTGRVKQELKLLWEILRAPYGSRQMFIMRCLYWLAYPVYTRKNIWITFDKLYKGGDCGEYFYKYLVKHAEDSIVPVYVINGDAQDRRRLEREGYHPAVYRSREQRLLYLYAKMVFGTHSGVNSFCGFNNWEIRFVQDRLRCVNTCIQHGLSVQNLEADSNRAVNNNKRYYCASRCEVENLSAPEYDYGKDVLRLTGIPRYDGLVNDDKRQILITPTWRSYIAMPSVMGAVRPYNPEFKNTEYYRIFEALLSDERLSGTARRTGYRIIYLLHPVISAQKRDFTEHEGIELVSALEVDYETVLTQSSLMVTDYSGVQFDFAYMRKPVVYYHPSALPPHYTGGKFDYEEQGFGEICTQKDELVELLCSYMEQGCVLKPFYRARQDDFFAYDDLENSRRIYEDALEYQTSHR